MGYIEEMRALVGHRPLILAAAGVLIVDGDYRLLLQQRSDDGLWGTPGGALDIGETLEQTARREVREETGLELGPLTLFDVFSGPEMRHTYPNGDQVAIVSAMFLASEILPPPHTSDSASAPTADQETLQLRWFTLEELASLPLNGPNVPIIARFRERFASLSSC